MKDSIICELYANAVSRAELIVPEGSEYMEACERRAEAEELLRKSLSEQQKALLENFIVVCRTAQKIEDEETYRQGVSLGVRITAEAFVSGRINDR